MMKKVKSKSLWRSGFSLLLVLALTLTSIPGVNLMAQGSGDAQDFDQMLEQLRQEFFSPIAPARDLGLQQIFIDDSDFVHTPPIDMSEYLIPMSGNYVGIAPAFLPEVYVVGSRRQFRATGKTPVFGHEGELVRQGDHVNIWILDSVDTERPSDAALDAAIIQFDDITYRMTRDFAPFEGVVVHTIFSADMPLVGDIHNDGRVNVLLHEGHQWGYFNNGNFMTNNNVPIAVFHVSPRLFNCEDLSPMPTFAHELQHLLFYMHFGVYASNSMLATERQSFSWFNETLSEIAARFWVYEDTEVISVGRLLSAAENSYANPQSIRVGDFINFNNSFKNYGMSSLHGALMHRQTAGIYVSSVYDFLRATFPISTTSAAFRANENRLRYMGMPEIVGNAFYYAGLTGSTGASGELAFNLLYFLFMENFAADGGDVVSNNVVHPTTEFIADPFSAHNLWGVRPNLGLTPGFVYLDHHGSSTSLSAWTALPTLPSGGQVSLSGYNGTPPLGATQDRFYRLIGESLENPVLTISIADDDPRTQFYVVIPNDPVGSVSNINNMQLGRDGATVHTLQRGNVESVIYTGGQTAYLFVATLFRNVDAAVTYSWGAEIPETNQITFNFYGRPDAPLVMPVTLGEPLCPLAVADLTRQVAGEGPHDRNDGWAFWGWFTDEQLDNSGRTRDGYRRPTLGDEGLDLTTAITNDLFNSLATGGNIDLYAVWVMWGDLNDDGMHCLLDWSILLQYVRQVNPRPQAFVRQAADLNRDGRIGIIDEDMLGKFVTWANPRPILGQQPQGGADAASEAVLRISEETISSAATYVDVRVYLEQTTPYGVGRSRIHLWYDFEVLANPRWASHLEWDISRLNQWELEMYQMMREANVPEETIRRAFIHSMLDTSYNVGPLRRDLFLSPINAHGMHTLNIPLETSTHPIVNVYTGLVYFTIRFDVVDDLPIGTIGNVEFIQSTQVTGARSNQMVNIPLVLSNGSVTINN